MGDAGPQHFGPYAIIRLLNEGPTGRTYLGREERRRKKYVIVKVFSIPLSTIETKEAFLSHAKQLKKLKRSNITEIQDFGVISDPGSQQDHGYLVIEYVEGSTILKQFVAGKRYAPNEIKPFLSTIADTLQYAHVSHILHGNLHPGNILLDEEIRLTDFTPVPRELLQSFDHLAIHALPYKAPEHLRDTPIAASDQYSMAVMVYEWLCGRRPYRATERETLLYQQEHEPIPSPRSLNSKISPTVEAVLLKALSPEPVKRFEHMLKFSDAYLRALMGFPMDEHKDIVRVQFIPPTYPTLTQQPENTSEISIDDRIINDLPTPTDEPLMTLSIAPTPPTPSPDSANEEQIDTSKQNAILPSNENNSDAEDEKENSSEKRGKRQLPENSVRSQFSRLHRIVTTDLGHGGILSERLAGYEERPAQIEMATLVARSLTEEQHAIIEAATGTGKALDVDTPIPTPTGWKRMGDLVRGDFVFDEGGHPTRVMAAFDVMYHRTCYEVVFSDGSSIVADAEHEWASYTNADRSWANRPRTNAYAAKNFITSDQLAMLDRLIALSQTVKALSVDEATALIGGHHWSVYQA